MVPSEVVGVQGERFVMHQYSGAATGSGGGRGGESRICDLLACLLILIFNMQASRSLGAEAGSQGAFMMLF